VVDGIAGALLSLLSLHVRTHDPGILAKAAACGDILLKMRPRSDRCAELEEFFPYSFGLSSLSVRQVCWCNPPLYYISAAPGDPPTGSDPRGSVVRENGENNDDERFYSATKQLAAVGELTDALRGGVRRPAHNA
jgi:hypothetical protein